ncbi:MerR family transcriptional regulator [Metabacillus arenae]|uniref:Chromosome-anchoring protein RacA n=1 Tax=Metabacillus arenae TaxID=2771434 RepID=A0A926NF58_9BACI|nr:MerR family transcriptional regulator [Metabacillus arenae]MBD1379680.1 MerR family transcriptional regulator [Metabacillus arenae]
MNTSAVAKELSVSTKTIQRWVKQLNLPMERNELGHYFFTDKDIDLLREVQTQIHNGVLLQEIQVTKPKRTGHLVEKKEATIDDEWLERLKEVERKVNEKADSVVSYQLLQHRQELEELQEKIKSLQMQLDELQKQKELLGKDNLLVFDHPHKKPKQKRKNLISSLLSF